MSNTVNVKGISHQTSEKEVRDFFSFCGKIQSLSVKPESNDSDAFQTASVTFEKETAARTALLLDNTQLGPAQVSVSSAASLDQAAGGKTAASYDEPSGDKDHIAQEEKPRSRVLAEYLAHGYVISDKAIERAIALDQQHGVSNRFMGVLQNLDQRTKASTHAANIDEKYGITKQAQAGWAGLSSYFDKAAGTPTGQKVRSFYAQGSKQVLDVHNEAKHLAGLKSGSQGASGSKPSAEEMNMHTVGGGDRTQCNCQAESGRCPCAPGTCACAKCAKNPDVKTSEKSAEEAGMEKVDEKGHTKCNCGGADGKCPCEPGKCACSGCSKAS